MNRCLGIVLVLMSFAAAPAFGDASGVPKEVAQFREKRDQCDHFRGEEAYDKERERFLAAQLKKYCTGTDAQLKKLKTKYKNDRAVVKTLSGYDDRIE
jgi:hypothetical protein